MEWLGLILAAYIVGSIPVGLILGKAIWKKDLRKFGSRNIGATNAWRVLGRRAGILVFILDFLKGQLGVLLGAWIIGVPTALVVGGLFAVVGHVTSIFAGFRGGKGVATGVGVLSLLMPKVMAIVVVMWIVLFLLTRYVSIASIVAAALTPLLAAIFEMPPIYFAFALAAAAVIVWRHRENLQRLREGRENKF